MQRVTIFTIVTILLVLLSVCGGAKRKKNASKKKVLPIQAMVSVYIKELMAYPEQFRKLAEYITGCTNEPKLEEYIRISRTCADKIRCKSDHNDNCQNPDKTLEGTFISIWDLDDPEVQTEFRQEDGVLNVYGFAGEALIRSAGSMAGTDPEGRLHGPVITYNGQITELRVFQHGLEIDKIFWHLGPDSTLIRQDSKIYLMPGWTRESQPECGTISIEGTKVTSAKLVMKSSSNSVPLPFRLVPKKSKKSGQEAWKIPEHILDNLEGSQVEIIKRMYELKCQPIKTGPRKLVADQSLYDQGHWHRRQDWTDRLSGDQGACSEMTDTWWVPGGALTPVQIACFPGSGSKWIMEMILFLTGLSARGLDHTPSTWLKKSHHNTIESMAEAMKPEVNLPRPVPKTKDRLDYMLSAHRGDAILILRNPREALASWWGHVVSNSWLADTSLSHEELLQSMETIEFCHFAKFELENWRLLALDYVTLMPDLLIVFYEEMKVDFEQGMSKVLEFLKAPLSPDRMKCLKKYPVGWHKRKKKDKNEVKYCHGVEAKIKEVVLEVDEALKKYRKLELPKEYFM